MKLALDTNYDARKYTVCCPWYGQRSSLFRLWQQAFRAGVADELDDDSSLDETANGTDVGGDQSQNIHLNCTLKLIQSAEYTLLVFEKKNGSMAINYVLFVSKVSKIPSHI